ncbi:putative Myb-related protein B [Amylocarpus encephaloides]|uniref:Myb-related protein B n=1 Tax=Amylocarpus encephaloides TaxID=45428 RepID=A0A9P7YH89_9HELO|nr:putative Myb-related protein B [Amylocarpus encephaloides]
MSKRVERGDFGSTSGTPTSHPHSTAADSSGKSDISPPSVSRSNKRRAPGTTGLPLGMSSSSTPMKMPGAAASMTTPSATTDEPSMASSPMGPPLKKNRTNTPWTPAEEQRLKTMRDTGNSWAEIAKTFPQRTEGSVKKHWYKDMHYAEFAEDESNALLNAIKEYETNKWKAIGAKVGKPAKACEQYAKEHFGKS